MKRFLSLISAVIFAVAIASPALAQNSTAASPPAKGKATISSTINQGKSGPKATAVKHHASGKAEHGKSKQEKKA
jgi:hypothetical protein